MSISEPLLTIRAIPDIRGKTNPAFSKICICIRREATICEIPLQKHNAKFILSPSHKSLPLTINLSA